MTRARRSFSSIWPIAIAVAMLVCATACERTSASPAEVDTAHDICTSCHMIVSDVRFAAQIVAPNEEPRFFDDFGCLTTYLTKTTLSESATVYVADHRTRAWVPARQAIYSRLETTAAPMGSHIVAHASPSSRDADPEARAMTAVTFEDVFAAARLPRGAHD